MNTYAEKCCFEKQESGDKITTASQNHEPLYPNIWFHETIIAAKYD